MVYLSVLCVKVSYVMFGQVQILSIYFFNVSVSTHIYTYTYIYIHTLALALTLKEFLAPHSYSYS